MYIYYDGNCNGSDCNGNCGYDDNQNFEEESGEDSSLIGLILGGGNNGGSNNLVKNLSKGTGAATVATFGPQIIKLAKRHPKLAALANLPIVMWFIRKYVVANVHKILHRLISYAMASITISHNKDKELYAKVRSWILTKALFKQRSQLSAVTAIAAKNQGTKIINNRKLLFDGHSQDSILQTQQYMVCSH